ncbi:MAG: hypothetical protein FD175_581 [Beijerinckiaceae bacterium]|nr:MAG: hypothetical protein FD175_581 [Beijerinckiaceae bacterium]
MRFESRTALTQMRLKQAQDDENIAHIRAELEAIRLYLKARREQKYSPGQPRDELGRWAPWDGHGDDAPQTSDEALTSGREDFGGGNVEFGTAPDGTAIEPVGGIPNDKLNWTTQQFMSAYCSANIRSVMPGQFLNMPIADVIALAKAGDRAANTCWKLLRQDRFRK